MALDIVSIPTIDHFKQDFVDLLSIGFGGAWNRCQRIEKPATLFFCGGCW
jgi:hypothetical protein